MAAFKARGLSVDAYVLGAAGTSAGAHLDPNLLAVHRQDRAVPLRDALRRTSYVVADKGAPEAVLAGVRLRAVYKLPVEDLAGNIVGLKVRHLAACIIGRDRTSLVAAIT
jgi:hypothetical protein